MLNCTEIELKIEILKAAAFGRLFSGRPFSDEKITDFLDNNLPLEKNSTYTLKSPHPPRYR